MSDTTEQPVVVYNPAEHRIFPEPERSLTENEALIRKGLSTFIEVGKALLDIRESGQYREAGFDTFDEYCTKRWGFRKRWAYQHLAGVEVVETLRVHDRALVPENLEQTKPLARVLRQQGEDGLLNTWDQIVESHDGDGPITGREIREYINPATSLAPSQRPVSDAYLGVLDKVTALHKSLRWVARTHRDKGVPRPVAERYADYKATADAIAAAVESIANGETPYQEDEQ